MVPSKDQPPQTSELRKAAFDGMVWGVGGKIFLIIANFAVLMVTSRALTQAQFGVFAAATIFTDFSIALASSTIGIALVQKKELTKSDIDAAQVSFLAMGLVLLLVMVCCASVTERILKSPGLTPVMIMLAMLMPFKLASGFYGAVLQRRLDMRYYQLSQNLPQILGSTGVTIVAALLGFGVWALVLGFTVATLLEFVMTAMRARTPLRFPESKESFHHLLSLGSASAANRLTSFVAMNADRVIAGASFGAGPLGIYARAYSLMMTPVKLFGLAAGRVFLPVFARMQHDQKRLANVLEKVIVAQTLVYLPISIGFLISAPPLVRVVLGHKWSGVTPAAELLFLALFARLGYVVSEMAAIAVGEAWGTVHRQAIYAGAVIVFGGIGSRWGVVGLAGGVTAALILFYGLTLYQSCRRFQLSSRLVMDAHLRGLALGLTCAVPAWLTQYLVNKLLKGMDRFDIAGIATFWLCYAALLLRGSNTIWGAAFSELRGDIVRMVQSRVPRLIQPRSRRFGTEK